MSTNSSPSGHSPQGQARRSQGPEEEETALPIVACRRCRKQKVCSFLLHDLDTRSHLLGRGSLSPLLQLADQHFLSIYSCDVHVNYLRVRDVQIFLRSAIILRLLIGSFWLLSDGKMLRPGLTEMLLTLKLLRLSKSYPSWSAT